MKVCVLIIATNKYLRFVERLWSDIETYFLPGHQVSGLLFTDTDGNVPARIRRAQTPHEPWPMTTLKRYHYFLRERTYIAEFDACYYIDADMAIVDAVGDEVLGDFVATMHPYQSFCPKEQRSYDRNPDSSAYVPFGEEAEHYYAGGFHGGTPPQFLAMCEVIRQWIDDDLQRGVMAAWHDESYLNRYAIDHPPAVVLSPSYCFSEEHLNHPRYPHRPKIVALQKDHHDLRS